MTWILANTYSPTDAAEPSGFISFQLSDARFFMAPMIDGQIFNDRIGIKMWDKTELLIQGSLSDLTKLLAHSDKDAPLVRFMPQSDEHELFKAALDEGKAKYGGAMRKLAESCTCCAPGVSCK